MFYERDPAEQMPALIPFIQDGLSRDEQFIYIADDQTVDELADRLQQSGINVDKESDRGALKLWTRREWRQPGQLSSQRKSLQVLDFISAASKSGFKGSRFAVEMTWTLGPDIGASELEHWEATLNTIFVPGFPGRIACQYNRSRLSPEVMLAALHTHPLAILGDHVYPNCFYEAPLIIGENGNGYSSAARVEWIFSQLKRARAAEQERERLEEQLRHAQKMESIGTLAGGIAHDFNNILNIIRGYASLISYQPLAGEKVAESLRVIDEAVERGASVVRQLLTLARKTEANLTSTNVNDLICELSKLLRQTFPKTIEIVLDLNAPVAPVLADPNQINQALLNLCVNARDAMPGGGKLTLRTKMVDGRHLQDAANKLARYVGIEVVDTGEGIASSVRNRIFEPFYTTKGIGEGTGLGLAIVYGIVKNHGGHIEVESQPGYGSVFRLNLPLALSEEKATQETSRESSAREYDAGGGTVLVVEDERAMVHLLRDSLRRHGYEVLVAFDGKEAIDVYGRYKDKIDVVLLDLGLPGIAGWDVLLKVKAENPNVNVIVASGYIEPEFKHKIYEAGVQDFIDKPYAPETVVHTLQALMSRAEANSSFH